MGKKLLTTAAIRRIISLRTDENSNHTFADIAETIRDEFGIDVSMHAVRKAYNKHKDTLPVFVPNVKLVSTVQCESNNGMADGGIATQAVKEADGVASGQYLLKKMPSRTSDGRVLEDWEKSAQKFLSLSHDEMIEKLNSGTLIEEINDLSDFE